MTYEEAIAFIHSEDWSKTKPGLSRTRMLLKLLGDPQQGLRFVHVAGTNGKGSFCRMLSGILTKSGYKTGLYTSPFIERFNERIAINGNSISDDVLVDLIEMIRPIALSMEDKPTEFEIVTALGMLYFKQMHCDIIVLEVGMGGELDSTNVIDAPELAVITTIGLDHTQYLGNTYTEIAQAKAGIIKPGCDVIFYGDNEEAERVIRAKSDEMGVSFTMPDPAALHVISDTVDGLRFDYQDRHDLSIPLIGAYQSSNASLVLTAVDHLIRRGYTIPEKAIREGLAEVQWRGRFELIHRDPDIILDGGHNPEGIRSAIDSLKKIFPRRKVHFLMGIMADKDVETMLACTKELGIDYVTVRPDNPRAMSAEELAERLRRMDCEAKAADTIEQGVRCLLERCGKKGIGCCIGSLYMSADVRHYVVQYGL